MLKTEFSADLATMTYTGQYNDIHAVVLGMQVAAHRAGKSLATVWESGETWPIKSDVPATLIVTVGQDTGPVALIAAGSMRGALVIR